MTQSEANPHATVMDSDAQQVGQLYGKAILGAAGSSIDEIVGQLNSIVNEAFARNPDLERLLASPRIGQAEKERLIDKVFGGRVHGVLLNFMKVLCRRGRIGYLRAVQTSANEMRDEQLGRVKVSVTTAMALTD
jgi:ATP synthase F1 delta subunit